MSTDKPPREDTLQRRVRRFAAVSGSVGGVAMKAAGARLFGFTPDRGREAAELKAALGGLKGPIMKVAQMLATIPDLVPPEYAAELKELQTNAPAMGWPFVKRRMRAELGENWEARFAEFGHEAAAAASLGQVHKAVLPDGRMVACKLQYPDMASAVESDLQQLKILLAIHRRVDTAIDTSAVAVEIGARLREELDYELEARHMALYREMLAPEPGIRVPGIVPELTTQRLLTMSWLDGRGLLTLKGAPQEVRNRAADILFRAWWRPSRGSVRSTAIRISAITPSTAKATKSASISWISAAFAPSGPNSSAASSISIAPSRPAMTNWRFTPTRPGVSRVFRARSSRR